MTQSRGCESIGNNVETMRCFLRPNVRDRNRVWCGRKRKRPWAFSKAPRKFSFFGVNMSLRISWVLCFAAYFSERRHVMFHVSKYFIRRNCDSKLGMNLRSDWPFVDFSAIVFNIQKSAIFGMVWWLFPTELKFLTYVCLYFDNFLKLVEIQAILNGSSKNSLNQIPFFRFLFAHSLSMSHRTRIVPDLRQFPWVILKLLSLVNPARNSAEVASKKMPAPNNSEIARCPLF